MEFFCFALPPAWKDAHPAGTDPREPVEFSFPLPRESWLWLELHDWADPKDCPGSGTRSIRMNKRATPGATSS